MTTQPAEPTTKAIEAKHTGWRAPGNGNVVTESGELVVSVPRPKGAGASAVRDARVRLIAAAPDLLAACESAIETLKRLQADGYLDNGGPSVPGSAEPEWPWYLSKFETDAKAAIAKAKGGVA